MPWEEAARVLGLSQPGNDSTATALSVQTSAGSLNVASVKAQWG